MDLRHRHRSYDDFKEIKDKYDELKKKYIDVTARLAEVQEGCDIYKKLYDKYNDSNGKLIKEMDKVVSEYAKLKEDYNKLVDENKMLTETLDKLRTKPDIYVLKDKNKWATLEEAQEFIDSIQQAPLKLEPVLSETPSVVINTKSINITFDNHTNNFKEDDTND